MIICKENFEVLYIYALPLNILTDFMILTFIRGIVSVSSIIKLNKEIE